MSQYIFCSLQEDTLQFFKEDRTEDAVYSVYLKKVRYHTSPDEVGIVNAETGVSPSRSCFYRNLPASTTETLVLSIFVSALL